MSLNLFLSLGQVTYANIEQNATLEENINVKKSSTDHLGDLNPNNPLGYDASPIEESVSKFEKTYNKHVLLNHKK